MNYRYILDEDYALLLDKYPCPNKVCDYAWVINNMLYIRNTEEHHRGYAWNGCSPAVNVLDLFWITTPDGILDPRTNHPITYYASLVHDIMCQYAFLPRYKADRLFYEMLKAVGFDCARLYYIVVRVVFYIRHPRRAVREYIQKRRNR